MSGKEGLSTFIDNNHRIPHKTINKKPNHHWAYHDNFIF